MIKNSIVLLCALCLIFACTNPDKTNTTDSTKTIEAPPSVGADKDKHGCKGSAGYTWSKVKNECIRIFEAGFPITAQDTTLDKSLATYIVFENEKEDNVEVFIPSQEPMIMTRAKDNGAGTWKLDDYTLSQWKGMYILEKKGKVLYQGMEQK